MPRARRRYFPNPPACAHLVPDLGADQVRPRRFSGALLMPIGSLARRVIPASVRKGRRNFLSPRHARTLTLDPGRIPWFDRPDALELLESRRRREHLSDADTELLTRWTTDGYCVAAGIIPADLIDSMLLDLDNAWTAEQPFAGLNFCDLRFHREIQSLKRPTGTCCKRRPRNAFMRAVIPIGGRPRSILSLTARAQFFVIRS